MRAFLEDFKIIKIIVDKDLYKNDFRLFNNNEETVLEVEKIDLIDNEYHIILKSDVLIYPNIDYTLFMDKQSCFLELGKITRSNLFDEMYYFDGWLGYRYSESETKFRVWSPVCKEMNLVLGDVKYSMIKKNGYFEITVCGKFDKIPYYYEFRINQSFEKTLDPYGISTDANSQVNYVVDLNKTYKMNNSYVSYKKEEAIIYEMNVRDSTSLVDCLNKGTFVCLTESVNKNYGLGYIKKLGITHIQLMPVISFGGVDELIKDSNNKSFLYNWGYNPVQYFVPSGFYSVEPNDPYCRINELKNLIDVIHSLNIGVNLDVVYNHVYDYTTFSFEKLVPGYTFRTDEYGFLTNSSWCGNDLNTNHLMVRKLIVDSIIFFQEFYRVDGFRFDLMGNIDIYTIDEIHNKTLSLNPNVMLYGEGWNMGVNIPKNEQAILENALKIPYCSFFNDMFRETLKKSLINDFFLKELVTTNIFNYNGAFINPIQSINYLECHDNMTLLDFLEKNKASNYVDKIRIVLALIILSPGIPFIHQGEELLLSKQGIDNSYNSGDIINGIHYGNNILVDTLIDLISIKKEYPHFNFSSFEDILKRVHFKNNTIRIKSFGHPDLQIVLNLTPKKEKIYFSPKTKLVFNGINKCYLEVSSCDLSKVGCFIYEK